MSLALIVKLKQDIALINTIIIISHPNYEVGNVITITQKVSIIFLST